MPSAFAKGPLAPPNRRVHFSQAQQKRTRKAPPPVLLPTLRFRHPFPTRAIFQHARLLIAAGRARPHHASPSDAHHLHPSIFTHTHPSPLKPPEPIPSHRLPTTSSHLCRLSGGGPGAGSRHAHGGSSPSDKQAEGFARAVSEGAAAQVAAYVGETRSLLVCSLKTHPAKRCVLRGAMGMGRAVLSAAPGRYASCSRHTRTTPRPHTNTRTNAPKSPPPPACCSADCSPLLFTSSYSIPSCSLTIMLIQSITYCLHTTPLSPPPPRSTAWHLAAACKGSAGRGRAAAAAASAPSSGSAMLELLLALHRQHGFPGGGELRELLASPNKRGQTCLHVVRACFKQHKGKRVCVTV